MYGGKQGGGGFDLVSLSPRSVKLFRTGGVSVRMELSDPQVGPERCYLQVRTALAFPLSEPDSYIGLRDGSDREIGVLQSLEEMDPDSRTILEEELTRRYFLPKIVRVRKVREEYGIVTWDVDTDKGPRQLLVRNLRESIHSLGPTRVLVTDSEGQRWEIPDVTRLEPKSLAIVQRVL